MKPSGAQRPATPGYFASHWRSLDYFNLYRFTLAIALVFTGLLFADSDLFHPGPSDHFQAYAYAYLVLAALFVLGIRARWPGFQIQLTAHITADILLIVLMMSTSDRLAGGMGLLLVISIASGGLVGSGRLTLLYAAMASIAVLMQHGFSIVLGHSGRQDSFFQTGLLSAGYFAIGWLANALTQRALSSETLAQQQADELALLNHINALAIENSPDGLLAVSGEGVVRHASPRALALLGQTQPVIPGVTRLETCCAELAQLSQPLQPGETSTLNTPNGALRVRCISSGTADDSRVLVLEDQRQAEEAAQRLKLAALGRLTANIAHEIRNPLSAITHAAQLLGEDVRDPGLVKLTEILANNARRLDRIVEEVLTLNRRDRLNPICFDADALAALIGELRETEEIPADAVIVTMTESVHFHFDPDHLRQIAWNLLRNAWRYGSRQPGSLRVSARVAEGRAHVDIEDDGPGIAVDHRAKLFEPFFTTDAQGTGLGLFLARELAEANHATLAHVAGSRGACFRLSMLRSA
jgi:two-component system sensor histidine kinase PilS (NtrC family)